jgi:hypothetical protein
MTAPNIVNVSTITGKSVGAVLTTTTTTALLTNAASSGKVFKVNTVIISNVDGAVDADATLEYFDGTTGYRIIKSVTVPTNASVIVLDKNTNIYLEEGASLRGGALTASDLEIVIAYEEIS